MEKIQFDSGVKEYRINGAGVLKFNPGDPNVYARFLEAADKIQALEGKLAEQAKGLDSQENGAVAIQIQSGSVAGNSSKTFDFSNTVKAVIVTAILNSYCASGFWTAENSGKTNRFYHMGDDSTTWDTTVTISGKSVTVKREATTTLTYIVTAITA